RAAYASPIDNNATISVDVSGRQKTVRTGGRRLEQRRELDASRQVEHATQHHPIPLVEVRAIELVRLELFFGSDCQATAPVRSSWKAAPRSRPGKHITGLEHETLAHALLQLEV